MPARRVSVSIGVMKMETKPIKAAVKDVKSAQKSMAKSFRELEKGREQDRKIIEGYRREVVRMRKEINGLKHTSKQTAMSLAKLTGGFLTLTTAVYAVGRAIGSSFREAIKYDRGLTLIRKTTKLAESELRTLSGTIMHLSSTLGVDRNVIAAAAGIAGRLGVNEVAQLEVLSEVATKLDKATNVDAARATQALAKVLTLTGRKAGDFAGEMRKAGDALVHLGNNAPVAEDHILNLAVPLAAVIGRFGGAPEDVLATSTALAVAEGQAQGAATAYQKLMTNVSVLARQGGPAMHRFAEIMGMSFAELNQALDKDLVGVLLKLLEDLKQFDAVSQINILRDIGGIQDLRSQQALLKSIPHLVEAMDLAYNAQGQLDLEDRIRRERTSGQWDVAWQTAANRFKERGDQITEGFVKIFKMVVVALDRVYMDVRRMIAQSMLTASIGRILGAVAGGVNGVRDAYADVLGYGHGDMLIQRRHIGRLKDRSPDVVKAVRAIMNAEGNVPGTTRETPRWGLKAMAQLLHLESDRAQELRENDGLMERERQEWYDGRIAELLARGTRGYADLRRDPAQLRLYGPAGASTGRLLSADQISGLGKRRFDVPEADRKPPKTQQYGPNPYDRILVSIARRLDKQAAEDVKIKADTALRIRNEEMRRRGPATQQFGPNPYSRIRESTGNVLDARFEEAQRRELEAAAMREHYVDLEMLKRRAEDERALTAMLRRGATAEEVAHQEAILELNRRYYLAREALVGEMLEAELASIELARERLKKENDKQKQSEALADRLTNRVADILREGGSIKDAWKGLMNELAADLLEKGIMEPFKNAMRNLILEALGYATAGQARGGSYGVLDRAGSWVMSLFGGGPGGYGSTGTYTTSGAGGIPGLARGGRVIGAGMALVGERGPELLSLAPPAAVMPLSGATGGVGGVTFNNTWHITSDDDAAVERVLQRNMPLMAEYNQRQLVNRAHNNSAFAQAIRR